jgi:hypothetical protein
VDFLALIFADFSYFSLLGVSVQNYSAIHSFQTPGFILRCSQAGTYSFGLLESHLPSPVVRQTPIAIDDAECWPLPRIYHTIMAIG